MKEQKSENRFSGMTREEIILEAKKQILHSAVLALAALIVIGVACYAWFVNSGSVTALPSAVRMQVDGFELACAANEPTSAATDPYREYLDSGLPEGEELTPWIGEKKTSWTSGNQTIRWRVDQDSNFANAGENVGIRPGSHGVLTFYVIPKTDGDLKINCHLSLRPVMTAQQTDEQKSVMDHEAIATQLLRGHILFDKCVVRSGTVQDGQSGLTLQQFEEAKTGYFELEFNDAKADEAYEVNLKWFWPYVLREGNEDKDYGPQISRLTGAQEMSDYFYFKTKNGQNAERETVTVAGASLKELSRYYNSADQFIGDHVDGVVFELVADRG